MTRFFDLSLEIENVPDDETQERTIFFGNKTVLQQGNDGDLPDLSVALGHHKYFLDAVHGIGSLTLDDAELTGWRYIVFKNGLPYADTYLDFGKNPKIPDFSHIGYGPAAKRTVEALFFAENELGSNTTEFELRHIEIPAFYFASVWLHADDGAGLFVPVIAGFDKVVFEIIPEKSLLDYLSEKFSTT